MLPRSRYASVSSEALDSPRDPQSEPRVRSASSREEEPRELDLVPLPVPDRESVAPPLTVRTSGTR